MAGIYRYLKKKTTGTLYDGWYLLPIVQDKAKLAAERPPGDGTDANPFRPARAAHWRYCSEQVSLLRGPGNVYLQIWGRLLATDHRCYVSDVGPAWRKGVAPVEVGPLVFQGDPNHYVNRVAQADRLRKLARTDAVSNLSAWQRRNTDDDPSYRSAAQKIVDPRKVYVEAPEGLSALTWKEAASSPMIAKAMRAALCGKGLGEEKATIGFKTQDYSRLQKLIPVMTVAWFLAEPARNARTFLLNLMLLDLAEQGGAFPHFAALTWDRLFWGPEILAYSKSHNTYQQPIVDARMAPVSDKNRTMAPVSKLSDLWTIGGVMSASPFGGANKTVKKEIPTDSVKSNALIETVIRDHKRKNELAHDYIHDKEISIATQWLQMKLPALFEASETVPVDWAWPRLPGEDALTIAAAFTQLLTFPA